MTINPLQEVVLSFMHEGKVFSEISPSKPPTDERVVTFYFTDGSEEVRNFCCDPLTFKRWWRETREFLRNSADRLVEPDAY